MTSSSQARAAVMDKIAALGHDRPLLERYFATVATADLRARPADDLAGAMAAHWQLARSRQPACSKVRVLAPELARDGWQSTTSVVQVVTDDMPFLVDSVTMAVRRCGLAIEVIIHPVFQVERKGTELVGLSGPSDGSGQSESFLHVEFERVTDAVVLAQVEREVGDALSDVRAAVEDWEAMRALTRQMAAEVRSDAHPDALEIAALLDWMEDNHFTFLGAADYDLVPAETSSSPTRGDRPMRLAMNEGALGILRSQPDALPLTPAVDPTSLVLLTKSERDSTVHRPVALDVVGLAIRDAAGVVVGERKLVGLFTSEAYLSSPLTIPLLRRKVADIVDRSGFDPRGHAGKELRAILEGYPRDELFGTPTAELEATAMGILQLQERHRVRLFARRDLNRRAWSCLVYLPRERYTTDVRRKMQDVLLQAFGGERAEYTATLSASSLARLHYVIHLGPDADTRDVDVDLVEERLADAVRSWSDHLRVALVAQMGDERGRELHAKYAEAFPASFTADVAARAAVAAVLHLERMRESARMVIALHRHADMPAGRAHLELYVPGAPLALADLLPVLGNLGVRVLDERPTAICLDTGGASLHDLGIESADADLNDPAVATRLSDAFVAVWEGVTGDDGFNRLVLAAGLTWREVAILRAYARYARQLGFTYSQGYIESTMVEHPTVAAELVALFQHRFDPHGASDSEGVDREQAQLASLNAALDAVASLDQDRILRTYIELILATVRTNAYQKGSDGADRPALALKLEPWRLQDAPRPRPRFEIFVTSPRVEGVHLRMASVARGGLRWSERPEDFRTEVLGLMKAQEVKNAVIVPSGAKGGFVVRRPPGERDALMDEVVTCYRTYVGSLLDVTDNRVFGKIVAPPDTRCHDGDDPYLVVAADKGTATFSDIANAISIERGFWLGDAFASGGSVGYDHKKMAITARGAWESVKRHFLRLGNDMSAPFTAVGIGDMSGDVFGNGMLLSDRTKLIAAFDHRHVFLDPDPDPATSHAERQRLFTLPRSSWDDYDRGMISEGGGVYPRTAKSVRITQQVRDALGLDDDVDSLAPNELVSAILRAPVDLLWNGGIGTYVKASTEPHAAAGDRANDSVRVDACDLQCKVVGEGGNLGFTQRARVEFALLGGLINSDAIDNSAGVDTSDHEVNLKILLDAAVTAGDLTTKQRDELLGSIGDDVGRLVLADNEAQNRLLVQAVSVAPAMLEVHERYIEHLTQVARLDRNLEALPDPEECRRRKAEGQGLVVPELAVLVAYTKMHIVDELLRDQDDDPALREHLHAYFPAAVRTRFAEAIDRHPLRREIAATSAVNDLVNRNGATYAFRMMEETGASVLDVVHAHLAATTIGEVAPFWSDVCALDGRVDHAIQVVLLQEADRLVERMSRWLLRNQRRPIDVDAVVGSYHSDVMAVDGLIHATATGSDAEHLSSRYSSLVEAGVPEDVAARAARMELLPASLDIARLAQSDAGLVAEVAGVYFALADRLALGALRDRIVDLPRDDRWQSLARAAMRDDLNGEHAALTRTVLVETRASADRPSAERVEIWLEGRRAEVETHVRLADEAAIAAAPGLATLSVVLRELRTLAGDR